MQSSTNFGKPIQLMLEHERQILWAAALFPILAVALTAIFKTIPGLYMFIIREDGIVEWATVIVYFCAAFFAAGLALHFWMRSQKTYAILYGGLAMGLLLAALEEMSWGQRLFNISTPQALDSINAKHELNFHNVSGFPLHKAFIVVGFYGAFSRLILTNLLGKRYSQFIELLTPPYALSLYFFIPMALYSYYEFLYYTALLPQGLQWGEYWAGGQYFITGKDQEPVELLLSFGFLLFTILNWMRFRLGAPICLERSENAGAHAATGGRFRKRMSCIH